MSSENKKPRMFGPLSFLTKDNLASPEKAKQIQREVYGSTKVYLMPRFPKGKPISGGGPESENTD